MAGLLAQTAQNGGDLAVRPLELALQLCGGDAQHAAAQGGDYLLYTSLLDARLLVGACDRVLEAGRVRGIAGDGDIDTLVMHDGNALADIVSTVAADIGALTLGVDVYKRQVSAGARRSRAPASSPST